MIHQKAEIANGLIASFQKLHDFIAAQSDEKFESGPESKWTSGQHLVHLIQSSKPLNQALLLPTFALQLMFGKPNRAGWNYQQLIDKYESSLTNGGRATGKHVPKTVYLLDKKRLLKSYLIEGDKLNKKALKLSDKGFDNCLLPHPLIGKITVREMLFFTIHHTEHHLQTLKRDYL